MIPIYDWGMGILTSCIAFYLFRLFSMNERTFTLYRYVAAFILLLGLSGSVLAHNIQTLVFTNSTMTGLDSCGYSAIQLLGATHSFNVTKTQSTSDFTASNLSNYDVLVFLNRNGNGFSAAEKLAFEQFLQGGKGFVAIHSAAESTSGWSWFDDLIGGYVSNKLSSQSGQVKVIDAAHPSSAALPQRWNLTDAFYNLQGNPRGEVHVLATLEESSIIGGTNGTDHPIAWVRDYNTARSFYTALGGTKAIYSETNFLNHLLGGIEWAGGAMMGDAGATVYQNFDVNQLVGPVDGIMGFDVASDGRIFYIKKRGEVWIYNPLTSTSTLALDYSSSSSNHKVYTPYENGMIGIALDPQFPTKPYVYIHYTYTAGNPWGGGPGKQRVVRMSVAGNAISTSSEEVLIEYDHDRDAQIHSGGCLTFDGNGNLLIATGDNTSYGVGTAKNPYAPIDERAGNEIYDAQRSSGNTNDMRGKILRITPSATIGGGYTVPSGNLFSATSQTKSEVYVMGVRNPFQICVNQANGWLAWGDVGPDATADHPTRGPVGKDELNVARNAGNYGWPYALGPNVAYNDYNFTTSTSGAKFDTLGPTNNSPNNTGQTTLPASQRALMWMDKNRVTSEFPELGTGNATIMAGEFFRDNTSSIADNLLPEYFSNKLFVMDWTRDWVKLVSLDQNGDLLEVDPFLPTHNWQAPMSMRQAPDGQLYIMEWGTDQWGGTTSRISKIRYTPTGRAPVAIVSADKDNGSAPLTVQFNGGSSYDPAGGTLSYNWAFGGTGTSSQTSPSHTFNNNGVYQVVLTVSSTSGQSSTRTFPVTVGNNRPVVTISQPLEGGFYDWEDFVAFQVSVSDTEDGSTSGGGISCANVQVLKLLGHDSHAHPASVSTSCTGTFQATAAGHVTYEDDIYYVLQAEYTDNSATGAGPLTGSSIRRVNPQLKQAEHYTEASGVSISPTTDLLSLNDVTSIDDGDWIAFSPMNLYKINSIAFRAAASGSGGNIEVHKGTPNGTNTLVATATIAGSNGAYTETTIPVSDPVGTDTFYFVFKNSGSPNNLFNLNWMRFSGEGISVPLAVEIVGFEAEVINKSIVQLNWEARSDEALTRFEIERTVNPSVAPKVIANVDPSDDRGTMTSYTVTDYEPLNGQSFYRLVQYDLDGAFTYTAWKQINLEVTPHQSNLKVYPNPTAGDLNVSLPASSGYLLLELFDLQGKRVLKKEEVLNQNGWHTETISTDQLPAGVYMLRLKNGGTALRAKVVVEGRR
ncbi:MAG: ThuA domain-containing protein [Bacteroidia bacterium]